MGYPYIVSSLVPNLIHLNDIEKPWIVSENDNDHDDRINSNVNALDLVDSFFYLKIIYGICASKDSFHGNPN